MDVESWRLFLETGDPLCYLLCTAERDLPAEKTAHTAKEDASSAAS